jgi:hypothetical protein
MFFHEFLVLIGERNGTNHIEQQCFRGVQQAGEHRAVILHTLIIIMSVAADFNTTQKKSIAVPRLNYVFEISPM